MLNFFESLVHKNDLGSITAKRQRSFNRNKSPYQTAIHFQNCMGILKAEESLNISSVIFQLNAEVITFGKFYYVKCLGNFPSRCNKIIIEMIKDSLKNMESEHSPDGITGMKYDRSLPINSA
jgi:hypothetical protein